MENISAINKCQHRVYVIFKHIVYADTTLYIRLKTLCTVLMTFLILHGNDIKEGEWRNMKINRNNLEPMKKDKAIEICESLN